MITEQDRDEIVQLYFEALERYESGETDDYPKCSFCGKALEFLQTKYYTQISCLCGKVFTEFDYRLNT